MGKKIEVRTFKKIANEIESLIRSGYLKVGDFLPGERGLATKLGVSRTSVREALRYLQSENIVTTIPGEGTRIIADDTSVLSETFSEAVGLSQLISLDLMEARKVIEVKNACFAAERATKTDLKRIGEILNNLYKALRANDEEEQERLNIPFHYAIARATHNVILVKISASISKIMQENITRRKFAISNDPTYAEIIYNQHADIYNAIRKGQCNEASQLMFHHFEEFIERCTPRKK